jgi:hypothetical protein
MLLCTQPLALQKPTIGLLNEKEEARLSKSLFIGPSYKSAKVGICRFMEVKEPLREAIIIQFAIHIVYTQDLLWETSSTIL